MLLLLGTAFCPVTSSIIMTPKLYMSDLNDIFPLCRYSGAQYPLHKDQYFNALWHQKMLPKMLRKLDFFCIAYRDPRRTSLMVCDFSSSLDKPKSVIFETISLSSSIFSGFISIWYICFSLCRWCKPSQMPLIIS